MRDSIEIRSLRVLGTHGALEHERLCAQPFELDLSIETGFAEAAATDALDDALDYGPIIEAAARVVSGQRFTLLETLAEAVAAAVLAEEKVSSVTVGLRKLRPPVPFDVESVGVRIERRRKVEETDG